MNSNAMTSFETLGLDARLLRALGKRKLREPTAVQAQAIPLALQGRDAVLRARTGSGKTLAYLLPAMQHLLATASPLAPFQAVVLVPTSELVEQARSLDSQCSKVACHVPTHQQSVDCIGCQVSCGQMHCSAGRDEACTQAPAGCLVASFAA